MTSAYHDMNLSDTRWIGNPTICSSGNLDCTSKQRAFAKVLNHTRRNLFKYTTGLAFLSFAAQSVYLHRLEAGLIRIPNDPFDATFGQDVSRTNPEIWSEDRQSFLRNVIPVPVHSHNDYEHRIPLFEALGSGCISVEADVHLKHNDLLVGHSESNLHEDVTLHSLYLEPLERILEAQNVARSSSPRGVFNLAPDQTLVLLVDLKSSGPETFAKLDAQLSSLRHLDYLTYWNGTTRIMRPLTIVASGKSDFESVLALNATHRDIFWDAKLDKLASIEDSFDNESPTYKFNQSNSYFASTEFRHAILYRSPRDPYASPTQLELASQRGLVTRYWGAPSEPLNLREVVWRVLVEAGVGVLNVDDLGAVRARARGVGKV